MESNFRISALLESARELTLDAAQSARSARATAKPVPLAQLKKLLDSRSEREVLDGLRKVISMMYGANPSGVATLFSSVIKNVAAPSLEVRKLVYIYLLAHAEQEPDLALLSINTIQKALSDANPQVRALALKTMSGIRVPVICPIVALAIKKGVGDMSPVVRRAAALAMPKCYRLDPNTLPQLLDHLSTLLGDKQYYVAGAAVKALMDVCPDRIDLIHPHYRALVKSLVDMDEWSQLATLKLMTIYARRCFPRRTRKVMTRDHPSDFYASDAPDEPAGTRDLLLLDPDLELLLKCIKPLLHSRNSAVVVAVCRCYINLGTQEFIDSSIGPLIALLRSSQDIQSIALFNIVSVCLTRPELFVKYATHFLIHTIDSPQVWKLKLEVLTLLFPHCDSRLKSLILNELEHFSQSSSDRDLVQEAVGAIGRCAQGDSRTSARCLRLLLKQISSVDDNLVAESLTVIRHMIQQHPEKHKTTVIQLAKNLDTISDPRARAAIIWLVGEFSGNDGKDNIAPDVLRILAKGFADEAEPAKLQIILLASKVYLHFLNRIKSDKSDSPPNLAASNMCFPSEKHGFGELDEQGASQCMPDPEHPIIKLWKYINLLARYDTSYDLRDRTRLYKALLAIPYSTQVATLMLLAPKPVPHTPSPSQERVGFMLGSATMVISEHRAIHGIRGYDDLPEWVLPGNEPDPSLRAYNDSKVEFDQSGPVAAAERLDNAVKESRQKYSPKATMLTKDKTLDGWLAEGESEEESEDDSEDDNGDEESESSEMETESEEGDTDDEDQDTQDKLLP
ncbi:AP-3 complex subunit beta-2 [Podosphaera aphanis]|nr:AP-3 complex subunit beta-2 [Podosphaera aphanis]